jgi:putative transposase
VFRISKDSPAYYISSVARDRLPVFRKDRLKEVICDALNEARQSASLLIFAYVVMPDHIHALLGSDKKPSEVLRYVNGISARRVINFLKESGYESSLEKLRRDSRERDYKYSLWDHHPNIKSISAEATFMEKVHYIHMNPVRAGLVERPEDYRFSSIRWWQRKPSEDEPLLMDLAQILWHHAEAQPRA